MNYKKIRLISLLLVFILLFTVGCDLQLTPNDKDDTEESTSNNETTGGNNETTGGNNETTGGNDETTGGNDETTGGNDETTGGNDETTGGNDETTGGNNETTGGNNETTGGDETTGSNEDETDAPEPPARPEGEYRILVTSDVHYTNLGSGYYGVDRDTRLQAWVDDILAEHKRSPFDLIIINGDVSLDYWGWNGGGSYQRNPKISDTDRFMAKYVSQLPQDVPIIVLPGNHELYTNEKWKELTGNDRNCSFVLGTNLFIMPDSFAGAVDPGYAGGGKNDSPYAAVDMDFINSVVAENPDCERIFLISHHFDMNNESAAFKNFLTNENRIVGLFSGHTHATSVKNIGIRNLTIAQTGNYASYSDQTEANFCWGFRDIYITKSLVASRYFRPENTFYVNGKLCTAEAKITDVKTYN